MLETDRAWAAGIMDGEGCIRLQNRRNSSGKISYTLRVSVSNTDPPMLRRLVELFGGGVWPNRSATGKPMWQWVVWSKNAESALTAMAPYLITKKVQAQVALESQSLIKRNNRPNENLARLAELDQRLRSLKREVIL